MIKLDDINEGRKLELPRARHPFDSLDNLRDKQIPQAPFFIFNGNSSVITRY